MIYGPNPSPNEYIWPNNMALLHIRSPTVAPARIQSNSMSLSPSLTKTARPRPIHELLVFHTPVAFGSDLGSFWRQTGDHEQPPLPARALDKNRGSLRFPEGRQDYATLIADSSPPGAPSDLLRRGERWGDLLRRIWRGWMVLGVRFV